MLPKVCFFFPNKPQSLYPLVYLSALSWKQNCWQTNNIIKSIYRRYKDNPMIRYKAEIKTVVGIPVSETNGMDI
jgi:hypothetical protein